MIEPIIGVTVPLLGDSSGYPSDCHYSNSHWLRTKGFGKINESVRLGSPEYEDQSATMIVHNKSFQQSDDELRVQHLVLDAINRTQSDDFDRFFDLFTPEATWMLPSQVTDVGLAEAKQFYRFTRKFRFEQQVNIDEVRVFAEVAFARLTFDGYLVPKADPTSGSIRSVSRHLWVMRKDAVEGWRLDRVIWNTPKPAEQPRRG